MPRPLHALLHAIQHDPLAAIAVVLALNALAYVLYAHDKRQARRGGWRVPERSLLLLALLGGWPASLLAQRRLRHKTSKQPFQLTFRLCTLANIVLVVAAFFYGV